MSEISPAEARPGPETGAPPPDGETGGWWESVKEAVHGSTRDLTRIPLRKAIFLLAVPMVLETVMESVFAVVDVFFVGRLGADAVATVGLTESLLTIVYAVAMGLSIGATAMVARRIGEQDPEQAARTAVQAIGLGIVVSVPLALAGILFARPILAAMGASPWVLEHGVHYAQVMFGSMVSVLLLFLINAIFRGAGDAAIAMRVLWLANGINVVLAPCFIFGLGPFPEMGVVGAGIATTIGRSTGVLYQLYRLGRPGGRLRVRWSHVRLEAGTMLAMLKLSTSGIAQALVNTSSWVVLVRIVSIFGSQALAGYTIAMRIVMFALLPSWGMANAAATLVGQSLGSKQPERGESAVWIASRYNAIFLGTIGALFFIFAGPLVEAFTKDPGALDHGSHALRIVSAGFLFYAFGMVVEGSFNGAGDTLTPMYINIGSFWLLELPLAWILAEPLGMGPTGVFVSITVSFSVMALASVILFRRGKWKSRVV